MVTRSLIESSYECKGGHLSTQQPQSSKKLLSTTKCGFPWHCRQRQSTDPMEKVKGLCSCLPIQVGWLFSGRSHFKPYFQAGTLANQGSRCFYITEQMNCRDSNSWGQRSKRKKIIEPCSWSVSVLLPATSRFPIFREERQTHRGAPYLRPLPWAATDQTPSALVSKT